MFCVHEKNEQGEKKLKYTHTQRYTHYAYIESFGRNSWDYIYWYIQNDFGFNSKQTKN